MSIYLDNSATTRVCAEAAEAMVRCMREEFYNPSALYSPALAAQKAMRACRDEILKAVDSANPGKSLWDLFKGRTVIVKELVLAKDRPFGETSKVDMQFSIFDYA